MAVGAAMTGSRPIVDLMFGCNQAAKTRYMSGGRLRVPMVLRTNLGATRRSAAQHSQSLHALVCHIPGLKVALPSSGAAWPWSWRGCPRIPPSNGRRR